MIIGSKIYKKNRCHNSLQWAKDKIETAPDGSVFLADTHEYTKGRQGRTWNTYKGQLLITILLKPQEINQVYFEDLALRINQLNMAIALGILHALKTYGIILKWPNDFTLQSNKVGGMITQVIWQDDDPQGIIVGFGLNVNNIYEPSDNLFDIATSLKAESKKEINQEKLLKTILKHIDTYYQLWLDKKCNQIYDEYKKAQGYLNKKITVHKNHGPLITGLFLDVLPNGNMLLEHVNGKQEEIDFAVVETFNT